MNFNSRKLNRGIKTIVATMVILSLLLLLIGCSEPPQNDEILIDENAQSSSIVEGADSIEAQESEALQNSSDIGSSSESASESKNSSSNSTSQESQQSSMSEAVSSTNSSVTGEVDVSDSDSENSEIPQNRSTAQTPASDTAVENDSASSSTAVEETPEVSRPEITGESSYIFRRNEDATISITGTPNTEYYITVHYKSGESTAEGLHPKTTDENGNVSWTWHIGGRTSHGTYKAYVSGANERFEVSFDVVD